MNEWRPGLDLQRLHTFYEVGRLGSVGAAARGLGRSQPAVSHRLRGLEDELGVRLFERAGRGIRLTSAGHMLHVRCGALFAAVRDVETSVRLIANEPAGSVSLGIYPTVAEHLLQDALATWIADHPALQVAVTFNITTALVEGVRIGDLDLALVAGERGHRGLDAEHVGTDDIVAAMAPSLAPRLGGQVRPAELRDRVLLAWSGLRDATFDAAHSYATSHGLVDERTPSIPHTATLRGLAARGIGYALLPRYTVAADVDAGRLVALAPDGLDHRIRFYVLTRPGQPITPGVALVRDGLRGLSYQAAPSEASERPE